MKRLYSKKLSGRIETYSIPYIRCEGSPLERNFIAAKLISQDDIFKASCVLSRSTELTAMSVTSGKEIFWVISS